MATKKEKFLELIVMRFIIGKIVWFDGCNKS